MRCFSLLLFLVFYTTTVNSQDLKLDWVHALPDIFQNSKRPIAVDNNRNVYLASEFTDSIDFNHGIGSSMLYSEGFTDLFVHKSDVNGVFLWAVSIGGIGGEECYDMVVDSLGNLYLTGLYSGTVDFDPGPSTYNLQSNGNYGNFLMKLDASGNFVWAKDLGGAKAGAIVVNPSNQICLTGVFSDTIDIDPGPSVYNLSTNGISNGFVQVLDSNGNFIWATSIGTTASNSAADVITDPLGNLYILGDYNGTGDFNPGVGVFNLTSLNPLGYYSSLYILKISSTGNFVWVKSIDAVGSIYPESITVDRFGEPSITASFFDTVDVDPGPATYHLISPNPLVGVDPFVLHLDANGDFSWARSTSGSVGLEHSPGLASDADGNVYVAGFFSDTLDLGAPNTSFTLECRGMWDIFIAKWDQSGNLEWGKQIGDMSWERCMGMTLDDHGSIYLVGDFNGTTDFDPNVGVANLSTTAAVDVFFQKLDQCLPTNSIDTIFACNSYTWIDGNTYTTNNDSATHTLTNLSGCDSVVTLDLMITTLDTSIVLVGNTLTSNVNNAVYQWIDCNNTNIPILSATNQDFTPVVTGDYAVIVTMNNCTDTSSCENVTLVDVNGLDNHEAIKVSPNPITSFLNVHFNEIRTTGDVHIVLMDMTGRTLYQTNKKVSSNEIITIRNLENFSASAYWLYVSFENGERISYKIIKE
jgi:uncharacterized protein (DUF2249 family)